MTRLDIRGTGTGPTIVVWNDQGDRTEHALTPSEAFALVRKLLGHLGVLFRPTGDRTDESRAADPELDRLLAEKEAAG